MAFQSDYKQVAQAGEITLRRNADGRLWADTISDAAWCVELAGKTAFADGEVDGLLDKASEHGLGLVYLENELA